MSIMYMFMWPVRRNQIWVFLLVIFIMFLYDLKFEAIFKSEMVSLMPFLCLFLLKQAGVRGTLGRLLGVFEVRLPYIK